MNRNPSIAIFITKKEADKKKGGISKYE